MLDLAEWSKLWPGGDVGLGRTWEIDEPLATKILTHFYPPTENNDVANNQIETQSLKATVVSIKDGVIRARLEGSLRMKHPFYHKDDDKFVAATFVGFLDLEPGGKGIRSLRLVTEKATYGGFSFGVAVQSIR